MKKIATIILILFTGLLFNNFTIANDGLGKKYVNDRYEKRCRIEYTRLYSDTGKEKTKIETSQFTTPAYCKKGVKNLSKKVIKWLNKKDTNKITQLGIIECKIKNVVEWFAWTEKWGKYKTCEGLFRGNIITNIQKHNSGQIVGNL
jgi:hypothetical protein